MKSNPQNLQCDAACDGPGLRIVDVSGSDGDFVTVDVDLVASPKSVGAFGMDLEYDRSMLAYVGTETGDLTNGWTVMRGLRPSTT